MNQPSLFLNSSLSIACKVLQISFPNMDCSYCCLTFVIPYFSCNPHHRKEKRDFGLMQLVVNFQIQHWEFGWTQLSTAIWDFLGVHTMLQEGTGFPCHICKPRAGISHRINHVEVHMQLNSFLSLRFSYFNLDFYNIYVSIYGWAPFYSAEL